MNPIIFLQLQAEFLAVVDGLIELRDQEAIALKDALDRKRLLLAPHSLQSAKLIGGANTVVLIDPTANDDRDLGLRNFDKARLNKDEFFMPMSIQLQAATNAGLTVNDLKTLQYGSIADCGAPPVDGILQNGEVNFRARSMNILRNFPLSNFVEGNTQVRQGEYILPHRRLIKPNDDIQFEVRYGSGVVAPANWAKRVTIHGLITVPNAG